MKKIIYISSFLPEDIKEQIAAKMKNYNFNSADAFSRSFYSGLIENIGNQFDCINILPLGIYPTYNSLKHFRGNNSYENGVCINSIPYCTIKGYIYHSIYKNLYKELKSNIQREEENVFIIYSINIPALKAIIEFKKRYSPHSKIILIIPDLIEHMTNTRLSRIKMKFTRSVDYYYDKIDGFVLLTEFMKDKIHTKKPYCIVEGIYNNKENRIIQSNSSKEKKILYSGMLYAKFGVKNLIDAFTQISNKNYRLQLCGCGELEDYIKRIAITDNRIEYLGLISREETLKLQSEADLLINPRQPIEEFTKYSFPSKNIEYLVSGKPVLIYELDGIPKEYYDYCFHIDKDHLDKDYLTKEIKRILSTPEEELNLLGERARNYIINEKNCKIQVRKILELINTI